MPNDSAEELLDGAPCGYISTLPDGTIRTANSAFEAIAGRSREAMVGRVRLQDLLAAVDRIYHETHYRPLLFSHGVAHEVALNLVQSDGAIVPVLLNSVLVRSDDGEPQSIRTVVFPAANRRLYEQEILAARRHDQEIALRLQRSLLAGELPQPDGLEIEVSYQPGVSGLEAGGDWYDVFWTERGASVALVVGDVVGRGLDAAMAMGQLRSAVRAFASTGLDPAGVLTALDRYSVIHQIGKMTTIVYAELTLANRFLRYACAGHPPPLLATPGRVPAYLMAARSMPIASWDPLNRTSAGQELEPGATMLLYTDGLVDSPSRPLVTGMESLRAAVGSAADETPRQLCRSILDELSTPDYHDDTCVVIARLDPAS
jgi:phosphoserine phosphatase RsbU/P